GFDPAGWWFRGLFGEQLSQREHNRGVLGGALFHSRASEVASSKMASFTACSLRAAANRRAVKARLLTLRRFGFELLVRRGSEQLALSESALLEEAIQGGGGDGGFFWPDRANSRKRVVPVRCGFSRLRRSMRSASCGVMVRDCPRSCRG